MDPLMAGGLVAIVVFIGAFIIGIIGIYNRLVALKHEVSKAWANIDVILKQRFDELPRLVEVCNEYVAHERSMIDRIMSAREKMVKGDKKERIDASNEISAAFSGLLAIGESYPELKSNQNFLQIQNRISGLEEHLADRREFYNSSVTNFNVRIAQIPYVFFAGPLGYKSETLFEVRDSEKAYPELNFKTAANG